MPRATQDADLLADLRIAHLVPLVEALQGSFYVAEESVREAIRERSCFNVIHLETMFKVDVFVLEKGRYPRVEMRRRQLIEVDEGSGLVLDIASPEDVILQKLVWYKLGGGISDRQWTDAMGVFKVQGEKLDLEYLRQWAPELDVQDQLKKALREADLL